METVKDKKKSRPPLGDIGNTQGQLQMSGDGHLSPEEDMENIKFMVEALERVVECEARAKVASEQIHKKDKAALEAKDEEMRKMKEDLEAADRAKELEIRKMKEDLEAANRARELDKAFLKVKDQLLEEMAAGLKNSDRDQVTAAAVRALCASLERTKNERDQMEQERDAVAQERDAALQGKQTAMDQLDDAKMQHEADVAAHLDHLNDMGRLFRG